MARIGPEEAIRVLQAALAADPSHQEARRLLVECYLQVGQTDAALEEIESLLGYHALATGGGTSPSTSEQRSPVPVPSADS
ncbi:MAG: tetratricopeptide repeat protein [Candidatus Eisenbacteria bacterium]|uniref:Tetratricopeptide repeat protein n=1 Tax=Eiseniibacteriota bacterium TaxID=2212470 RepID=A0A956RSI7_UNCEI|nr:tetratricopeptide repeat protein [Candidatus Eisenbacteria bacterium]